MKNKFTKKLAAYAVIAEAALISSSAVAQVVYTDVEDQTLTKNGDFYAIDFDKDGNIDMQINHVAFEVIGVNVKAAIRAIAPPVGFAEGVKGNSVLVTNKVDYGYAAMLDAGYTIYADKAFTFNAWGPNMVAFQSMKNNQAGTTRESTAGEWLKNANRKYLGVKFPIDGKVHYGWIRMSVSAPDENNLTATIHDFAYESTPTKPLLTGAGTNSVENLQKLGISIFPNPSSDIFNIKFDNDKNFNAKIIDITGREIYTKQGISSNEKIDLSSQPEGVYFITLENDDAIISQKLIISR